MSYIDSFSTSPLVGARDDSGTCELSAGGRAFSTILTAFAGMIMAGVSSGHHNAFHTAWICWMSWLRILVVGIWEVAEAVRLRPLNGGEQFFAFYGIDSRRIKGPFNYFSRYRAVGHYELSADAKQAHQAALQHHYGPGSEYYLQQMRLVDDQLIRENAEPTPPTFFGWLGWAWAACYSPIVQTLWLCNNWNHASGGLKIAHAIGVSVTALPLTMDTRARYGAALGQKFGLWSDRLFTFITAVSCLFLGIIASIELGLGAARIDRPLLYVPVALYVLFSLAWTYGTLAMVAPRDKAPIVRGVGGHLAGLGMGLFGGLFVAAPAFAVYMMSTRGNGGGLSGLSDYLRCESVELWRKASALLP